MAPLPAWRDKPLSGRRVGRVILQCAIGFLNERRYFKKGSGKSLSVKALVPRTFALGGATAPAGSGVCPRGGRSTSNFALQNRKNEYYIPRYEFFIRQMSSVAHSRDRYLVKSIVHSSQLLTAFRSQLAPARRSRSSGPLGRGRARCFTCCCGSMMCSAAGSRLMARRFLSKRLLPAAACPRR